MKNKMKAWRRPGVQRALRVVFVDSIKALLSSGAIPFRHGMDMINNAMFGRFGRQAKRMAAAA